MRIINKARGRVWVTKLCIRSCNEPRTLHPPQRTHFGTIGWLLHWLTQKAEVSENPHTSLFGRNQGWQPWSSRDQLVWVFAVGAFWIYIPLNQFQKSHLLHETFPGNSICSFPSASSRLDPEVPQVCPLLSMPTVQALFRTTQFSPKVFHNLLAGLSILSISLSLKWPSSNANLSMSCSCL